MAHEERNRLSEWLLIFRTQAPILRQQLEAWVAAVRAEPWLFWDTTAVRYITYGVGGLILFVAVSSIPSIVGPPPPPGAHSAATQADFHVVCSDPECAAHFVVHRKFGFHDFPVLCPKCGKRTGQRALRCNSKTCQGQWVAPQPSGDTLKCPVCGKVLGPTR